LTASSDGCATYRSASGFTTTCQLQPTRSPRGGPLEQPRPYCGAIGEREGDLPDRLKRMCAECEPLATPSNLRRPAHRNRRC
jgi:hypothetical protein